MKVFEPLKGLAESCHSGLVETMVITHLLAFICIRFQYINFLHCHINMYVLSLQEICLLGSITGRWNTLIESFISHSFCFIPISKKYADLHQCLHRTSQDKFQHEHLNLEVFPILDLYHVNSLPRILYVGNFNSVRIFLKYGDCTPVN